MINNLMIDVSAELNSDHFLMFQFQFILSYAFDIINPCRELLIMIIQFFSPAENVIFKAEYILP